MRRSNSETAVKAPEQRLDCSRTLVSRIGDPSGQLDAPKNPKSIVAVREAIRRDFE